MIAALAIFAWIAFVSLTLIFLAGASTDDR